jgi:ATP-dependent helicase/DNAse subunit B
MVSSFMTQTSGSPETSLPRRLRPILSSLRIVSRSTLEGMAPQLHLVAGPAGAGKTRSLIERFRAEEQAAPGSVLWLGPSQRGVEALRAELLGAETAGPGAPVLTFQEFADEIVRVGDAKVRSLSGVQRRLLIEDVIAELDERAELSHFTSVLETRGFPAGVADLVAELKRGGVTPAEFTRLAYQHTAGDQPDTSGEVEQVSGRKEWQCARIYHHYELRLKTGRLLDPEGRVLRAATLVRQGKRRPFGKVRLAILDGFSDFTAAQRQLIQALAKRTELWISLPDEAADLRAELFARPRATRVLLLSPFPKADVQALAPLPAETTARPTGLAHLERQLFRPLRKVEVGDDAAGIACLETPGMLGEARLVARRIALLLRAGTRPEDVIVAVRDLGTYADLLKEVFEEYGLPLDLEGDEPLARNPAVAVALRALYLPEDDWPFAGVTALLRNTYFRPQWSEAVSANIAQRSEVLLRLLGEPRGRDAYLGAVERWAEQLQPGLEDEQAQESRRRRTHELAGECRAFLKRFFGTWNHSPDRASLDQHARWLRSLTTDLGIASVANEDPRDAEALACLWNEIDRWQEQESDRARSRPRQYDRRTFHRRLLALAGETGLPRTPRGPGRVRVLSAEVARHLDVPYLFVLGLGERSFPRLAPPQAIFDESERQAFQQAGVEMPGTNDLLPGEMLLFYQLVTRATREVVLCYPAVDERGQPLLPSSFLTAVRECFAPDAIPTERRRMLLERYDEEEPLSAVELRVRLAAFSDASQKGSSGRFCEASLNGPVLPPDLLANLRDTADLVQRRFHERDHNPYDGLFTDAGVIAELGALFAPEKVFSPTALEDYVACPFKFFFRHVLHLEPLEEPREEIEVTRRGQACHRALARLHRRLQESGIHRPDDVVADQVRAEMQTAVEEDVSRAPSLAAKALWQLEGKRLLKLAARYPQQWERFLKPWPPKIAPRPHFFEIDFGLPSADDQAPQPPLVVRWEEIEVRISGRIDRVDVADLPGEVGFWIIDYKTGRSANYTSPDLARFRKLQLTLYALAVEEVLLAGQAARPLGLAYWLIAEAGPKVVLPGRKETLWLDESKRWRAVREELQRWVATLAANIRGGVFPLEPRSPYCTQTCDYGQVCRITQSRSVEKSWSLPLPMVSDGA